MNRRVIWGIVGGTLLLVLPGRADRLVLHSGDELEGEIQGETLELETERGRVEIPFDSLRLVEIEQGAGARVELVDGTSLRGRLVQKEISLNQGLFDRSVSMADVRRLVWDPPTVMIPRGTPLTVQLIQTVSSKAATAGGHVRFCVAAPVEVEGSVVIDAHAPAVGQVLGAGGGMNVQGGGSLGGASGILVEEQTPEGRSWRPIVLPRGHAGDRARSRRPCGRGGKPLGGRWIAAFRAFRRARAMAACRQDGRPCGR